MNSYLCPPKIEAGNLLIILSPSGCVDRKYIDSAKFVFESWSLSVKIAPHADIKCGRFAGSVEQRLHDLQKAMDDVDNKIIFCSRGGYGAVHLLEKLDFTRIKNHPKWLIGYSDITALHLAFAQHGIQSLHAPMARHLTEYPSDRSTHYLKEILLNKKPTYTIDSHSLNKEGRAKGRLLGGNLSVLVSLIGTPYMNLPTDTILFIEDINESAYKIDRMFWQLKLSGILSHLSGLIIGQFAGCSDDQSMCNTIYESIRNMVAEYNYPVVFDFPVGHGEVNFPMIHGAIVNLSVDNKKSILEF